MSQDLHGFKYFEKESDVPSNDGLVVWLPNDIHTEQGLLTALADRLDFPGYFGFNWDALNDCLRDMYWLDYDRVVIAHRALPKLPNDDLEIYLDILKESVQTQSEDLKPAIQYYFPTEAKVEVLSLIDLQS